MKIFVGLSKLLYLMLFSCFIGFLIGGYVFTIHGNSIVVSTFNDVLNYSGSLYRKILPGATNSTEAKENPSDSETPKKENSTAPRANTNSSPPDQKALTVENKPEGEKSKTSENKPTRPKKRVLKRIVDRLDTAPE